MGTTIIRLIGYALTLVIMLSVLKIRKFPIKETLGLNRPKAKDILLYAVIFLTWVLLTEFITFKFGLLETGQWKEFALGHIVLRGISICLIAPIVEELVFRGLLFTKIRDRFGSVAAIFLPAILFALLHLKLSEGGSENIFVLVTFIDAVFYAYIRNKTNSTYITILLHCIGNSVALIERLL